MTPAPDVIWNDVCSQNVNNVEAIMKKYKEVLEAGIHRDEEQLRHKEVGGDPATAGRSRVRKQCKPQGPCGLLLEPIHLPSATLDEKGTASSNTTSSPSTSWRDQLSW